MKRGRTLSLWWQLPLVALASAGFESLYLHNGLNPFDEGWPLYAAMQLHAGGTLYRDVFFVFPPGHVLAAWIGYGWNPPGVVEARFVYAGFTVALCASLYLLGRRLMPGRFALLGALMLACAASRTHLGQSLFGYRYLAFSVLALLCFAQRLESGDRRWMLGAGALTGIALCFRLTPAFAAAAGIAAGIVASSRSPREWVRDALWFGGGFAAAAGPVVLWFAASVGFEDLWREAVVRPVAMTALQDKPVPPLRMPEELSRKELRYAFNRVQFRLWAFLYVGFAATVGLAWLRSLVARRPFEKALLLSVVVWGGVYWLRALGRSDIPHLYSAIPPVLLLVGYAVYALTDRGRGVGWIAVQAVGWLAAFGGWVFFTGADEMIRDWKMRGTHPIRTVPGNIVVKDKHKALILDYRNVAIRGRTRPGDTILDLGYAPIFYVLNDRRGPGFADVVIPGTFLTDDEERAFVERLEKNPPALVIVPERPFDGLATRTLAHYAPRVSAWLEKGYRRAQFKKRYILYEPIGEPGNPPAR